MAESQSHILRDLSGSESGTNEVAHEDPPVTRRYQTLLLVAGFFTMFQVIGINSIYGIFQVSRSYTKAPKPYLNVRKEFYTSPKTNIVDGEGQDALVSLVGTIGSGLTWSGGILVNPFITRVKNVKYLSLGGGVIMSIGLFLASFSTRVCRSD